MLQVGLEVETTSTGVLRRIALLVLANSAQAGD